MWFILYGLWSRRSSAPLLLPNKNKDTRTFFQGREAPSCKTFLAGPSVRKRKANPPRKFMGKKKKAFTGAVILLIVYHRNPTIHQLIYSNQTHKLIYHIRPTNYLISRLIRLSETCYRGRSIRTNKNIRSPALQLEFHVIMVGNLM